MNYPQRETYEGKKTLIPEIAMLGYSNLDSARVPGLKGHSHPNIFEIFLIDRGEVEWWTENQSFNVNAGHAYINQPGEKHGSSGHSMKPCAYFWVQIEAKREEFLPTLSRSEADAIFTGLESLPHRYFAVSPTIRACFDAFFHEVRNPETFSSVMLRAHLHHLLVTVLRDAQTQPRDTTDSPIIENARRLITTNPDTVSPAFLATELGLSTSHFHERFLAETGFTPHAYIIRTRLEVAKELLSTGEFLISDVAFRVGFSSGQHFATVFKKIEGISPSEFVRRKK